MRNDKAISGLEVVDRITTIGGPSAAELRRPLEKSLDQIEAELQHRHRRAVRQMEEQLGRR
jgi:hypothetical protein